MERPIVVATGPSRYLVGGQRRHIDLLRSIASRLGYSYLPVEIGRRPGESGRLDTAVRLVRDYVAFADHLGRAIRSGEPVVVHINSSVQYASLVRDLGFAWIARWFRPETLLVQIHGCELHGPEDRKPYLRFLARLLARTAGRLVVLSRTQTLAIGGPALRRSMVIPNSIQLRDRVSRDLQPESPLRVLFLARIVAEKGICNALDAVALLRDRGTRMHLTVAGEGPLLDQLAPRIEALKIADKVAVLGAVDPSAVRSLLASHDVMWAPYLGTEGQPYSLIEALEAGIPIIATAGSLAMREMIETCDGAIIEVAMTAEGLAAKTESLAHEPGRLEQLQLKARQVAEREFSVDASLGRWQEAWSAYPRRAQSEGMST